MTTFEHAKDATPDDAGQARLVEWVLRARTFGIIAVLALFVIVTASIQSRFVDSNNIQFILSQTSLYALIAVGEAMVIITRNVDLSVGSIVGLSAYVSANQFGAHPGISIIAVFGVGLGIGLACGLVSGTIVAVGRVPSLVVTLAMLYIIRGIDTIIVGSKEVVASTEPASFNNIPDHTILGVPVVALVVAVVVAIAAYYMRSFRSGRDLYAVGSEPSAATLVGIPTARRVFGAFMISGGLAGIAGVLWAAQYATITSTAASGLELQVIAAVVVGGVAIFGGSGTVVGAALGALLLQTINSSLNVLGIPSLWTDAISGFLLLVAITLDRVIQIQQAAALRRRRVRLGA
jgi:rhamnose transport system permease protein